MGYERVTLFGGPLDGLKMRVGSNTTQICPTPHEALVAGAPDIPLTRSLRYTRNGVSSRFVYDPPEAGDGGGKKKQQHKK